MANLITPQNLWSEMLKHKKLLNIEHGFTIPFLVGAYHKLGFITDSELTSSDCIKYIINNILESASTDNPIKIFDCPNLSNELVLQYLKTDLTTKYALEQMNWESNINKKIYWHPMETEVTDIKTLIEWLWTKPSTRGGKPYGELISSKRFSSKWGHWDYYNEKEVNFIDNIGNL